MKHWLKAVPSVASKNMNTSADAERVTFQDGKRSISPLSDNECICILSQYWQILLVTFVRSLAACLVPRMGRLGEAACDCAARRKVAMVEGVRFWHKAAAYHVNAEQKRDILCLWKTCNYKLKGFFFSNKTWQIAAPSFVTPKNQ